LIETGNIEEAVSVLLEAIRKQSKSGTLVVILARAYHAQGNLAESKGALWRALKLDPNQANGVEWWASQALEKGGRDAYEAALNEIVAIDGAWRPQLWLGRLALEEKKIKKAMTYYKDVFCRIESVPAEVATQVSGDLGKAGQMEEMIEFFGSPFDGKLWGILTGNNVVSAFCSLGKADEAQQVVKDLEELGNPQWESHIAFMKELIDDHRNSGPSV